ncbi:MAG: ParB/RepB/Spo0J family partition protein [Clostridia bacterium]|nr:ParB/RepB/Spo0J family partition protein [Clostridia bacterium]
METEKDSEIKYLSVDLIGPNPAQPRKSFPRESLRSLADSIARNGVLQPLIVRRRGDRYELIAGERRFRAASLAGLARVPCLVRDADDCSAAELALIENVQREDLNFFEEAEAIRALIDHCGLTQEKAAARLSCSQSYVANKLRLLKLTPEERETVLRNSLTERHARAALRVTDGETRKNVLKKISEEKLTVSSAEELVESVVCAEERKKNGAPDVDFRRRLLMRDMRLFYNSIDHAVESVRSCGFPVESERKQTAEGTLITILVKDVPSAG